LILKNKNIIYSIDDLSIEASNSLLKLIEEPNKNSHFIIINHNKAKVLQTIKSRSYFLNFSKLNEEIFFENLNSDISTNRDLFNLTNGSLSLSRNFINHELYEIQDHFRELLNDRKLIKSNTASHYSNFISKMFTKDEDISIFFDYIYLITSCEVKTMARRGKEKEVLNLLKISEIVKTYRNYFKILNLDYTTLIVSLFYKIKNV
jgi:DNA polymerase III delta prime subunit